MIPSVHTVGMTKDHRNRTMEFKVVGFMGSCMLSVFLMCKKMSFSEALAWGALDSDSGL